MKGASACLLLLLQGAIQGAVCATGRVGDDASGVPEPAGATPGKPDLVHAALGELRQIDPSVHSQRHMRTGVFGAAARLALRLLPSFRPVAQPPPSPSTATTAGSNTGPDPSSITPLPKGPLGRAVQLLEEAARRNNSDALYLLAEMNFYGNFSYPRNFDAALSYYHELAALDGNSSALHMLGLMYSTGLGGAAERDQARALLYYTFAAIWGHTRAEMTIAARYSAGVATPKNCEEACRFYKRVADKAIEWHRSGPPGGMGWAAEAHRIADDIGGVYGDGASASSAGINSGGHNHGGGGFDRYASIEDIIEYLDLMVHKGDFKAAFNLGRIYHDGQRGLDRDLRAARKYFMKVAARFWQKDGRADGALPGLDKVAGRAAGYLGRMHMRGDGVEQNFERARFWFSRGITQGDAQSQYGLGLLMLRGFGGISRNLARAADLLKAAADQDFPPAQVELGALYLDQGGSDDVRAANDLFEQAARYGNIEAHYYLAELIYHGVGRDRSCSQALSFYRSVAEKAEPLVSSWAEANRAFGEGDREAALLQYLGAAEQGYERAQSNVAFLLDAQRSSLPLPSLPSLTTVASALASLASSSWRADGAAESTTRTQAGHASSDLMENPSLGLIYWTRSSRQGNIDSLVKMGDYYLSGLGADSDVDKAVQCYTGAADYHQSAQALYNLGWMHEHGVGLDQDYHLAKRYYDEALMTNDEAYLPVTLSLLRLRAKSAWNTLTHGRINSIQDEPAPGKDWSLGEWIANFLQDDQLFFDDGQFDDMYDPTMPGGDGPLPGELDDGLAETLVILGLAAALAFLVYYRQQRQQAHREENAQQRLQAARQENAEQRAQHAPAGAAGPPAAPRGQQERGGMFPPPDDPDFQQWIVGGVGH